MVNSTRIRNISTRAAPKARWIIVACGSRTDSYTNRGSEVCQPLNGFAFMYEL